MRILNGHLNIHLCIIFYIKTNTNKEIEYFDFFILLYFECNKYEYALMY